MGTLQYSTRNGHLKHLHSAGGAIHTGAMSESLMAKWLEQASQ